MATPRREQRPRKAAPKPKLSVFIIGPMADPGTSSPFTDHTRNVKRAVARTLAKLGFTPRDFTALIPDELPGAEIVTDVFHQIDTADLAIADISGRSPNVFYELAILNALGTPTVILDQDTRGDSHAPLPFYFKQMRVHRLKAFSPELIESCLDRVLPAFFRQSIPVALTNNPISDFYQAPLVDISAAAGLAAGYFDNFVVHVLRDRTGVCAQPNADVDELVILRPERVDDFDGDEKRVKAAFPDAVSATLDAPSQRRGRVFCNYIVGKRIIDIPTPLYSLQQSPRFRALQHRVLNVSTITRQPEPMILLQLQRRMIAAFFAALDRLVRSEHGLSAARLHVVPMSSLATYTTGRRRQRATPIAASAAPGSPRLRRRRRTADLRSPRRGHRLRPDSRP